MTAPVPPPPDAVVPPGPEGDDSSEAADRAEPQGVGRGLRWAVGGYVLGFVLSLVAAIAYLVSVDTTDLVDLSIVATALLQVPLWIGLGGAPLLASRRSGTGSLAADYGLRFRGSDIATGVGAGLATQLLVLILYTILLPLLGGGDVSEDARELADRAEDPLGIVVLVVIVVIGAPIVEELFYRGLLLRALERRWSPRWALIGSSVIFGVTHYQALQLPALIVVGLITGALVQRTGRLGPAIVTHMTFNAVTIAALLAT